ncbi:hypothetical protein EI94DRAFT_1743586 [Lactarius quietus]|nr:hypothetical protein EI94DRAFT_1743586 [Lactarius quietus]
MRFIDAVLRLASGGTSRPDEDALLRDTWPQIQASLQNTLHALDSPLAHAKRSHQCMESWNLRRVDITLHARSLRIAHAIGAVARCPRAVLTRVFLLPTRSRATGAPQWTALLLAGDTPTPTPTASRKSNDAAAGVGAGEGKEKWNAQFELAFSVLETGAVPRLTLHSAPSSSLLPNTSPSSLYQALLSLLSSITPSTPSAVHTAPKLVQIEHGAPLAGVTAFHGAGETSLWFFDGTSAASKTAGILADAHPAEFWALADLAAGGGQDDEGEETEFQMIDERERDGIMEWVRKHKPAFGIAVVRGPQSGESDGGSPSSSGSSSGLAEHEGGEESNEAEAGEGNEGSAEAEDDEKKTTKR